MVAVEYREEPCKSALNRVKGMGFRWTLNPYTGCSHRCTFCYVRGFELRAERPWDARYGTSIRVKTNIAEVLRWELSRRSWKREGVVLGAATDPYQPVEGRYRLTRKCLEALAAARTPISIITRGPMIVRDIDVLSEAARKAEVSVNFSVPTLDLEVWRKTEPGTAPPKQRLRALSMLVDAGIKAGVAVAPVLPGLSDGEAQIEAVVRAAREAGATHMWCAPLNLRPGTRDYFLERLAADWPALLPRYEELYAGTYLGKGDAEVIAGRFRDLEARFEIRDRRATPIEPPAPAAQLALFGR